LSERLSDKINHTFNTKKKKLNKASLISGEGKPGDLKKTPRADAINNSQMVTILIFN